MFKYDGTFILSLVKFINRNPFANKPEKVQRDTQKPHIVIYTVSHTDTPQRIPVIMVKWINANKPPFSTYIEFHIIRAFYFYTNVIIIFWMNVTMLL